MYQFGIQTKGDFASVVDKTVAALKEEGFGVLVDLDIAATLKEKLDLDKRPYRILGACNPPLANKALEAEPDIGLLLPCNVIVREQEDGSIRVAFMDPAAVMSLVEGNEVADLAQEVRTRLQRVADALSA